MSAAAAAEHRAESTAPAARTRPAPHGPAAGSAGGGAVPEEQARRSALGQLAVQTKSVVGSAGDRLEREADEAADRVMRAPGPPPLPERNTAPALSTASVPSAAAEVRRQASDVPPGGRSEPLPAAAELPALAPRTEAQDTTATTTAPASTDVEEAGPGWSAVGPSAFEVPERVQALLEASRGRGHPLPVSTRAFFESAFRRDFAAVRIHDHEAAHAAAAALGARAFTHGNDIYLAAGAYDPVSESGRRLLAHELAHVVQGDGDIRRSPATSAPTAPKKGRVTPSGGGGGTVELFALEVPQFKKDKLKELVGSDSTLTLKRWDGEERTNTQGAEWAKLVREGVQTAVSQRLTQLPRSPGETGPVHYLQHTGSGSPRYLIGTEAEIAERLVIPPWDKEGHTANFDIDHKLEVQLGGEDSKPPQNLWLLESSANRSAGGRIARGIKNALRDVLAEATVDLGKETPTYKEVRERYNVTVQVGRLTPTTEGAGNPSQYWEAADMQDPGKLTKPLQRVPPSTLGQLGVSADQLAVFSTRAGGALRRVRQGTQKGWEKESIFRVTTVTWKPAGAHTGAGGEEVGSVIGTVFKGIKTIRSETFELPLHSIQGIAYGGYVHTARYPLVAEMFSPVEMDTLGFDVVHGFVGRGRIVPSLPLLAGKADIGIVLDERGVGVSGLLTADSFNLPGPFRITGGHIALSAQYPAGISAAGRVGFELEKLAKGWFEATAEPGRPFGVTGELDFDTDLFTRARLGIAYQDGRWSVTGELGIGEGKVTGIRSASVKVAVDAERVTAVGTFESSLRGLQGGRLGFSYDPPTGTTIEGRLTLGRLPGISGGTLTAKVAPRKDGQGWSLAGDITAQPAIPGVTGSVTGRYEDGAFLAEAVLGYERGLLNGRLQLGVTNQQPGPDGRPAGPPQPNLLLVYGGGELSLRLTPWLIGTARVAVRPNGTIAVAGRIALPDTFELFARRELDRRLFSLGIDIPIVGVAVAGRRIGIFATIRGGLDLVAGIGPGQLRGTGIEVRYDPDREDATQVEGDTRLLIPADAGLRLFVQGGIGVGIPVVSATAGIELGGQLGLAGQLSAGVHLLWTRSRGLVLDAEASLTAQPSFRFTADAFVLVTADLVVTTVELYEKRWKLAAFDYGSALTFGVSLPLHAEAGRFDFSFDRLRLSYPSIDPAELARGVLHHVFDG